MTSNIPFRPLVPALLLLLSSLSSCGEDSRDFGPSAQIVLGSNAEREGLPNWATPEELELKKWAPPPSVEGPRVPPSDGFRLPAEYEPTLSVVMTWRSYTSMLQDISVQTAAAGAEVWMVGGPSSLSGVPADQYEQLNFDSDTVWARDYGPFGIQEVTGELGIIDTTYRHYYSRPDDDAIPCEVAGFAGASCYSTTLILDGGNLMTDGQGNLFMTRRTYDWNDTLSEAQVNQLLIDYFSVHTIHALDYAEEYGYPADGTGHIDMFAKLLAPCTVLVAESTDEPFETTLDEAAAYFASLECAPSQTYQVYRIPGWYQYGTWYTYTNSLIVNQTVIVPSYNSGNNTQAQQIYQSALPGYTIAMVDSDDSIGAGGSIHCITKEIPVTGGECQTGADCDLPHVNVHDCIGGACTIVSCDSGWANCDGNASNGCETALGGDYNCSGCGDNCTDDFAHASGTCQGGSCTMGACDAGWLNCDGNTSNGCEAQLGSAAHCTGCYDTCADDFAHADGSCQGGTCVMGACDDGWGNCDGQAANGCETVLGTDTHCAGCTDDCTDDYAHASGTCQGGSCTMGACDPGWLNCDGNTSNGCEAQLGSAAHCTGCYDSCADDFAHADGSCQGGSCVMGSCDSGWLNCDGNTANGCEAQLGSPEHCTGCYDSCNDDYAHASGSCQAGICLMGACDSGWYNCDGYTENGCETQLGTDTHCSGCADDCTDDYAHASGTCQGGSCAIGACDPGWLNCDGNTANGCEAQLGSAAHCTGCYDTCADDFAHASGSCQGGTCVMGSCDSGWLNCDGNTANGCEAQLGSPEHCTGCYDSCNDDFAHASGSCQAGACSMGACDNGWANCDGQTSNGCETALGTDTHCAGCTDDCTDDYTHASGTCQGGSCTMGACQNGWANCDGVQTNGCETALGNDNNCAGCGDDCTDDFAHASGFCQGGVCTMGACDDEWSDCDGATPNGCETPVGTDENCSGCGDDCNQAFANAYGTCFNGVCIRGGCHDGWADCNIVLEDGCEVELGTDTNCGLCGDDCTDDFAHATGACVDGSCVLASCNSDFGDCDGNTANGCETGLTSEQNCGTCQNVCTGTELCIREGDNYSCIPEDCPDADGDSYRDASCGGSDCDDLVRETHPGATEFCDGVDNNCDGATDEGDVCKIESTGCGCGNGNSNGDGVGSFAGILLCLLLLGATQSREKRTI